jgi:hypothetical protein
MARTKGIIAAPKPKSESLTRCIEYKQAHIGKSNSGDFYAVFNYGEADETRTLCDDLAEARRFIDCMSEETATTDDPRPRGRRTKGVKAVQVKEVPYEGMGHGGYTMNPPADCQYRCKFEKESPWWVNNVTCHGTCKVNATCPTFLAFMKGSKERIKLMGTEKMSPTCPHCKALISLGDFTYGEYQCGTTYNRVTQEYVRVCKPPEVPKIKKGRRTK